jgi:hypothetical protein
MPTNATQSSRLAKRRDDRQGPAGPTRAGGCADILEAVALRPHDGAPLFGVFTHLEDDSPDVRVGELAHSTRAHFLLTSRAGGQKLAVTLTEAPEQVPRLPGTTDRRRFELEYLFLRVEPNP